MKADISPEAAEALGFRLEPGWHGGYFTRNQHPGALPNGTRVKKTNGELNDITPNGEAGTILGSIGHPAIGIAYFVEYDNQPRHAIFTVSVKLTPLERLERDDVHKVN